MAKPNTEHYHPDVFSPPGPCFACDQAMTWPSSGMKEMREPCQSTDFPEPCPAHPGPHCPLPLGAVIPCSRLAAVVPADV